jgi:hypothetical protein
MLVMMAVCLWLMRLQYETNVEALRVKRKKARNVNRANRPSDYSIIQRLHGLYTRALEKFKVRVEPGL